MSADLIWGWSALAFAALAPAALWAGRVDRRRLSGASVWAKPFKFALSLAIHYATFAVILRFMREDDRQSAGIVILAAASSAAGACELAYIALQAARGRPSHFNDSTAVEAVAALLMGVGALIVIAPAAAIGLALIAAPPAAWPAAVTAGAAAGLIGGTALTVWTASRMGAVRSHFATGEPVSDRAMPITGWSLDGADLRPAHFLATHMMQALPIAGLIAAGTLPPSAALVATLLAAIVWTAMTAALFRRTVKGSSLSAILGMGPRPRARRG
jgi:hypothetical protein